MDYDEYAGILHDKDQHYYIIKQIGEGATSFVYGCISKDNKEYAVKIYTDPTAYSTEIEIFSTLQYSKHIVKLISYGEAIIERGCSIEAYEITSHFHTEEINYAIFEYLSNGELFNYIFLPKQSFSEEISKKIFLDILDSVETCHKSGISHGDIKLENLGLSNDFTLKLIDFGFSKIISNGGIYEWIGTKNYSSPEMYMAVTNGFDGIQNDVFSGGVVLFILVAAQMPFDNATFSDSRYKLIIKGELELFWKSTNIGEQVTYQCKDLINKMLCYYPKERIRLGEIRNHLWISGDNTLGIENQSNICSHETMYNCSLTTNGNENEVDEFYCKEFNYRKEIVENMLRKKEKDYA